MRDSRIDPTLPSGKPPNWPHSTDEELEVMPQRDICVNEAQKYRFPDNKIKTSKYEWYTFLFLFLAEEFNPNTKVANCYFLFIAALQCVPVISNTNGVPTFLIPLSIVVSIDALFQAFEDIGRHQADAEANSHPVQYLNQDTMQFETVHSSELCVGDFVKINNRDAIPADVIIVSVAEKSKPAQGICYVETKQLDGETNLKTRFALPPTAAHVETKEHLKLLNGGIKMEHPNNLIDSFTGVIDLSKSQIDVEDDGKLAIQPANLLLRGCVLRNTEWVFGLVINTGHDTKIMMSATTGAAKTSSLEGMASKQILNLMFFICGIAFIGACANTGINTSQNFWDAWYLDYSEVKPGSNWFIMFFYFFLLHASMIPVSLYVSMSLARAGQMYFMNNDLDMYYEKLDAPQKVRTMNLNEDLGRVSHIFSDKTGTLTSNIMDFRKMSINGVIFGKGITEIGKASWKLRGKEIPNEILEAEKQARINSIPHVSFYCDRYDGLMAKRNPTSEEQYQIEQNKLFFKILSLCHDTVVEHSEAGTKFSASNPDDEALVAAAAYFGQCFADRQDKFVKHISKDSSGKGTECRIEMLSSIKFTSKRKRMSVIIRDTDNKIKLLMKGADTMMMARIRKEDHAEKLPTTMKHVEDFSGEGLRCLLLGWREISESEYNDWHKRYNAATSDLEQIGLQKIGEKNDIEDLESEIEMNCALVGSTALEDKLQDGVPECIAKLAEAGIVLWILTGDKEETAINIAIACNLLQPEAYMDHIIINEKSCPDAASMRKRFKAEIKRCRDTADQKRPKALVIDGPSLITAMEIEDDESVASSDSQASSNLSGRRSTRHRLASTTKSTDSVSTTGHHTLKDYLKKLTQYCKAVVACRVSPDQKKEMVEMIRYGLPKEERVLTLAIGDGANDVPMIQGAHVGVGIRGEEGQQAVNASDYAIAQFRFLQPLLLKHGRYNYVRMSRLVLYTFYKNVMMSLGMYWFNVYCAFSGQKLYPEFAIQFFNLFFTGVPIVAYAIYDRDIDIDLVYKFPQIYESRKRHDQFNAGIFWRWMLLAIVEAMLISILSIQMLLHMDADYGMLGSFWAAGGMVYTVVVLNCQLKVS